MSLSTAEVLEVMRQELARAKQIIPDSPSVWTGLELHVSDGIRRMGYFRPSTGRVSASRHHADAEALRGTVRHELAHVVAWRLDDDRGHGADWKARARQLGTSDARCGSATEIDPAARAAKVRYHLHCSACDRKLGERMVAGNITRRPERYRSRCCRAPLNVIDVAALARKFPQAMRPATAARTSAPSPAAPVVRPLPPIPTGNPVQDRLF